MIVIFIAMVLAAAGMFLNRHSETLMYSSYHAKDSWHEYMIRKRSSRYYGISIACLVGSLIILLVGLINY